ncbi:ATP phosphoribosyltransferase regulatory subunit [Xylophilus rhododendri]|uniref:ATP phosphoribosyltransferase regulatory subunit n=1 Tax=Xylophilus rhododendri TaxID=2697032 RepID=A0A857JDE1_9BURK|nr:ATP phosphoribosyltransferase regulatory subunit [Xylophilus rhododendri]QHJ00779.1 ATP phosphoribosyltransferase regulatory subunit [Xylophilus rhododendri]
MSAWVLPDHIADVLPSEARHIEELRRDLLDTARSYGYELVMPPLLEHLESLLTGTGEALDLQTFKLVDQLSGRMLGLRADTTQQVARIDAHLLNRQGVTRLCYCGPVLHTRPGRPHATREPLQFGAEIYGHAGVEADVEVLRLALDCLAAAELGGVQLDLGDARIPRAVLAQVDAPEALLSEVRGALAAKDASGLAQLSRGFQPAVRDALAALVGLYGGSEVLDEAAKALGSFGDVQAALQTLRRLAASVPAERISFDLADLRGYAYYSGARFSMYVAGASDAIVRGGRYDEVGAVFGRNRPAVGFSLDLRELVGVVRPRELRAAIRAPWSDDATLSQAIGALRAGGETVVCVMPGHESEIDEFRCDRELALRAGSWTVLSL